MHNIGDRVGAIFSAVPADKTVYLIGYGTYEGDQIPPPELGVTMFGMVMDHPNPCIKLDDGTLVFGCECWWGSEEKVRSQVGQYETIVPVDMAVERARANPEEAT